MRDTEVRTSGLDFLPAISAGAALVTTLAAVAVLAVVFAPAVVWPGQYADLAERFFRPWITPPAYAIDAAPARTSPPAAGPSR